MAGPHPAVAAVRRAARSVLTPDGLIVACSGGADSLALAAAVAFEADRCEAAIPVALVTIDHGLQDGSAEQAAKVAALGYELGFDPVEVIGVEVGTRGGRESAARAARYAALDAMADALDRFVVLGHTLDDQAETVLMGLGRGSGPRSIAGMRFRSGRHLRPFLGVRRSTTEAACRALGLEYWDDPHNDDRSLQRVRLRREVLPLLEDVLQGGVAEALARTASQLRDDDQALAELALTTLALNGDGDLDVDLLEAMPKAVRTRVLKQWAGVPEVTAEHVERMDALITDWHGQRRIALPGGVGVRRRSGTLVRDSPNIRGDDL
jgi:tRNA(Ile)-lysidine synthase